MPKSPSSSPVDALSANGGPDAAPTDASSPTPRRFQAWHGAGIVLLLAVGGLLLYGFWPVLMGTVEEEDRPEVEATVSEAQIEVVEVTPVDFPLRAEATGALAPWRQSAISAEAGGRIVERPVEEGQRVAAGAVLYRLDDRDVRIELEEARSDLLQARAEYGVALRQEDAALALPDTSFVAERRAAYEEAQAAHARGEMSDAALQTARRQYEAAQVLTGRDRSAVQAAVSGLAAAEQRLERAELALERTRITAPYGGRVADLEAEVGQRVGAGEEVAKLLDDSRMKVRVDVLESDLVRMTQGGTVRARLPALEDRTVEGTIHAINPRVDPATGTGRVTAAIPNPDGRLVGGLFAYVELETERLPDRLVVPADAVLVRQGRDLVFRVADGRAEWVYVEVGARSGDHVEITDGLRPGDRVAVAGHFALAHDAPVEVAAVQEVAP
ncbi:MAG: efflux RND transporter periplasmic adaptor subunit [Bacteroidetes bacterium]|jgi:HlyD family secretion protein|nr:efflux RND transporter periplasmic adaptor subunit [Bacteroidota bacterium]